MNNQKIGFAIFLLILMVGAFGCFEAGGEGSIDAGAENTPDDVGHSDGGLCAEQEVTCDGQCVDLESDLAHCGGCGNVCDAVEANMLAACEEGSCTQGCAEGWVDADDDPANGCELECEISNGGVEICDGLDNDCDGEIDGADADGATTWYADRDDDGFGDSSDSVRACDQPDGFVEDSTDCDDEDAAVYVVVEVYRDGDGDGWTRGDAVTHCTDGSMPEGHLEEQNSEDCNDTDPDVNPGADELCSDGVDNNCDGDIDEESAVDAPTWYVDCDGDGFSADTAGSRTRCDPPASQPNGCTTSDASWTDTRPAGGNSTDCNDEVPEAFPGQDEWFIAPMSGNVAYATDEDWDYDCDGQANFRWDAEYAQCEPGDYNLSCIGNAGWVSAVQWCGTEGAYQNCHMTTCSGVCGHSCNDNIIQKLQECR